MLSLAESWERARISRDGQWLGAEGHTHRLVLTCMLHSSSSGTFCQGVKVFKSTSVSPLLPELWTWDIHFVSRSIWITPWQVEMTIDAPSRTSCSRNTLGLNWMESTQVTLYAHGVRHKVPGTQISLSAFIKSSQGKQHLLFVNSLRFCKREFSDSGEVSVTAAHTKESSSFYSSYRHKQGKATHSGANV